MSFNKIFRKGMESIGVGGICLCYQYFNILQ